MHSPGNNGQFTVTGMTKASTKPDSVRGGVGHQRNIRDTRHPESHNIRHGG